MPSAQSCRLPGAVIPSCTVPSDQPPPMTVSLVSPPQEDPVVCHVTFITAVPHPATHSLNGFPHLLGGESKEQGHQAGSFRVLTSDLCTVCGQAQGKLWGAGRGRSWLEAVGVCTRKLPEICPREGWGLPGWRGVSIARPGDLAVLVAPSV